MASDTGSRNVRNATVRRDGDAQSDNGATLVVAGDRDPVCKPEASQRMYREIAGSQLALLKPAKHMGLIEHHYNFAGHVSHFVLASLSAVH